MADNNQYKWRQRKKRNTLITVWIVAVIIVSAIGTFAYEGMKESNPLNVAKSMVEKEAGVDEYEVTTGPRSLNNDNQFVQEYTFNYTSDGKEETKTINLVQSPEKKFGVFEQWETAGKAVSSAIELELIAPVDSQVLIDGAAPRDSEIKVDEQLSPGAVCYDLAGVEDGATLQVNGLPFDSFETTLENSEPGAVVDIRDQLVVGTNAKTQMTELAKTMINELFTAAMQDQKAEDLSKLFDQCPNKANLFKAISGNLYDKGELRVNGITFKGFEPSFGEVYYPGTDENAYIGMEMKLAYTCEYTLVEKEAETENAEETEAEAETEQTEAKKAEKQSVQREATFYFKYIDGSCVVTSIEVPNAIS